MGCARAAANWMNAFDVLLLINAKAASSGKANTSGEVCYLV